MLYFLSIFSLLIAYVFLRFNGGAFKATSFPPLFFTLSLLVGVLGFNVFNFAYGMPFEFGDSLPYENFISSSYSFFTAILAFSAGCTFYLLVTNSKTKEKVLIFKRVSPFTNIFIILIPAFFLISAYGFSSILSRIEYIPEETIRSFKFLGRLSAILMLLFLHRLTSSKLTIFFVYLLYFFIFFGYASRTLALLPLCYLVSFNLFRNDKGGIIKYILLPILSIAFASIALQLRSLDMHGIIPYFLEILNSGVQLDLFFLALNYLTSFSYSLTAYLSSNINYSYEYFLVSIHPALGSMVGWDELSTSLRVNKFVPYNGLSELSAMGLGVTFSYFFISGLLLKFMEVRMSQIGLLGYAFAFCICALFSMEIMQYNLRSATRTLYYGMFLFIAFFIYKEYFLILLPKKRKNVYRKS